MFPMFRGSFGYIAILIKNSGSSRLGCKGLRHREFYCVVKYSHTGSLKIVQQHSKMEFIDRVSTFRSLCRRQSLMEFHSSFQFSPLFCSPTALINNGSIHSFKDSRPLNPRPSRTAICRQALSTLKVRQKSASGSSDSLQELELLSPNFNGFKEF